MDKNQQKENGVKIRKRAWLYAALGAGVLLFAAAVVLIVLAVNGVFVQTPTIDNENPSSDSGSDSSSDGGTDGGTDDDVNTGTTVAYVNPVAEMTVLNEQGFFYNSTLDCYYEHVGVDISADAGSEVYAVCDATVEAIYTHDVLNGTQIVLVSEDGVQIVYSYVDPVETLETGDTVAQGELIATVSEATGGEYKSGAHLHLEMYIGEELVDPADYLTFEEK